MSNSSNTKFSWSKFYQSLSKTLDLLEGGSANIFEEIENCGRWSETEAVILPEIISVEMALLKILSIRVLE